MDQEIDRLSEWMALNIHLVMLSHGLSSNRRSESRQCLVARCLRQILSPTDSHLAEAGHR